MANFTSSRLWRTMLAEQPAHDEAARPREILRNTYLKFRERSAFLAAEIARDLPEFTVHDVTHLDALWEMADLIAGPEYPLTPTEAFVLGGAILIHDLGMGLAAYPEGVSELRREAIWLDTIASLMRDKLGRSPTEDELNNPSQEIERQATTQTLRSLHAKQAERLALISWKDQEHDEQYYLIEDNELRRAYGPTIGRVAHSHWWEVDTLGREFIAQLGAPIGFPKEWTVDPVKIACLLRTADASHIDARRAPGVLRAFRSPSNYSRQHWIFQENLQQPRLDADRLVYTAGHPFSTDECDAWWLCYDTLRMIDKELRHVDALLADKNRVRLAARGVAGIEDPVRLKDLIPTSGWIPVDTRIRISDVAALVNKLGGTQLYGNEQSVPLRELIQNSSDAVRARRLMEGRSNNWGDIYVRMGQDSEGDWIEVEDNGIGMSTNLLSGLLIDFGKSYWGSELMLRELPRLISKGFQPTGKYGIGFFSTFMWGDHVRVVSRRYDDAQRDTKVLEFGSGLTSRAMLRPASPTELIREGGTRIRVWLKTQSTSREGLLYLKNTRKVNLKELCGWLCPSLDVNLYVEEEQNPVISASDWLNLNSEDLFRRIHAVDDVDNNKEKSESIRLLRNNLQEIRSSSGDVVGRLCIHPYSLSTTSRDFEEGFAEGVITVGGLRSNDLVNIGGILLGSPLRASRDAAIPLIEDTEFAKWASEQAEFINVTIKSSYEKYMCALIVISCTGNVGNLPIAWGGPGWLNSKDISAWEDLPDEILLFERETFLYNFRSFESTELNSNALVIDGGGYSFIRNYYASELVHWPLLEQAYLENIPIGRDSTAFLVIELLAKRWSSSVEAVLQASEFSRDENKKYEIGKSNGKILEMEGYLIRKPKI